MKEHKLVCSGWEPEMSNSGWRQIRPLQQNALWPRRHQGLSFDDQRVSSTVTRERCMWQTCHRRQEWASQWVILIAAKMPHRQGDSISTVLPTSWIHHPLTIWHNFFASYLFKNIGKALIFCYWYVQTTKKLQNCYAQSELHQILVPPDVARQIHEAESLPPTSPYVHPSLDAPPLRCLPSLMPQMLMDRWFKRQNLHRNERSKDVNLQRNFSKELFGIGAQFSSIVWCFINCLQRVGHCTDDDELNSWLRI